MVFSSVIFIFAFLPCVLFGYYVLFRRHRKAQNVFLFLCSLLFYSWGGFKYVFLILFSIFANWLIALCIQKNVIDRNKAKLFLVLGIIINVSVLFVFKYLNFTADNIQRFLHINISISEIALPIGISFFTFQGMSYVIDVYRKRGAALRNPLEVGLYIAFFPQLIAGPIVRYETVAAQIHGRTETVDGFCEGIRRFIIGLAKKAILANSLAIVANQVFTQYYTASVLSAWIGAIAYTLQIYFDFSGYSDMAIGLGKMFGFTFEENFNRPYLSSSISEFWRRWHISMGTWFRDYVYFPLGGSRVSTKAREYFNLFIVWLLTGLWHGANWTFILWGLVYFVLILLERLVKQSKGKHGFPKVFGHLYTLLFVILGWVLFNSSSVSDAFDYYKSLFFVGVPLIDEYALFALRENALLFILAIICCFPIAQILRNKLQSDGEASITFSRTSQAISFVFLAVLFILSVAYVVKSAYNPFIYFNF